MCLSIYLSQLTSKMNLFTVRNALRPNFCDLNIFKLNCKIFVIVLYHSSIQNLLFGVHSISSFIASNSFNCLNIVQKLTNKVTARLMTRDGYNFFSLCCLTSSYVHKLTAKEIYHQNTKIMI